MLRAILRAFRLADAADGPGSDEEDALRCRRLSLAECQHPCIVNERLGRCDAPPKTSFTELPPDVLEHIWKPLRTENGFRLSIAAAIDRSTAAIGRGKETITSVKRADRPTVVQRLIRDIADGVFDMHECAPARSLLFPARNDTMLASTALLCETLHDATTLRSKNDAACEEALYMLLSWYLAEDAERDEWIYATDGSEDDNALIVLALMPQQLARPLSDPIWKFRSILTHFFLQRHRRAEQGATPPVRVGNAAADSGDETASVVRRKGALSDTPMMERLVTECIPDVMIQVIELYGPIYEGEPPPPQPAHGAITEPFNPYLSSPSTLASIVEFVHRHEGELEVRRESVVLTIFALRLCELTPFQIACALCQKLGTASCTGRQNFDYVEAGGSALGQAARDPNKFTHLREVVSELFEEALHAKKANMQTCLD